MFYFHQECADICHHVIECGSKDFKFAKGTEICRHGKVSLLSFLHDRNNPADRPCDGIGKQESGNNNNNDTDNCDDCGKVTNLINLCKNRAGRNGTDNFPVIAAGIDRYKLTASDEGTAGRGGNLVTDGGI